MFNSSMSNYPGGFANGISIRGMPLTVAHPGRVFWVLRAAGAVTQGHRTGSDGNDGSFSAPFATLDYAIGRCTAARGDIIMIKPGHTETISTATALALDVAGIAVVGLGTYNSRPTFTLDTATTAELAITAANISLVNLLIKPNLADIVRGVSTTVAGTTLFGVDFLDTAVDMNVLTPIKAISTTDNANDGLDVRNCKWFSPDAASVEFIEINANLENLVINGNQAVTLGTASPLFLVAGTKITRGMQCLWNYLQNANTAGDIAFDNGGATNSGVIAHNRIGHSDVTGAHVLGAVAGARFFDNLSTSVDNLSGLLLPAADVDL